MQVIETLAFNESQSKNVHQKALFFCHLSRRDAWLSVAAEQKVRNRFAISLLFYEAYTNFIDGNLPCNQSDGVKLAALFLATEPKRDFAQHLQVI